MLGEPFQELAQSGERALDAALAGRASQARPRRARRRDGLRGFARPGKARGQKSNVLRQQSGCLDLAAAPSDTAASESIRLSRCLVRNRLSLVTAPRRARPPSSRTQQLVERTIESEWFCRSRSGRIRRARPSSAGAARRPGCRGPDDAAPGRSSGKRAIRLGASRRPWHPAAQLRDHLAPSRPFFAVLVQEPDAEPHQIFRQPRDQRIGRRG